jgi:hypothetical protein
MFATTKSVAVSTPNCRGTAWSCGVAGAVGTGNRIAWPGLPRNRPIAAPDVAKFQKLILPLDLFEQFG